jgi:hypothetical protein
MHAEIEQPRGRGMLGRVLRFVLGLAVGAGGATVILFLCVVFLQDIQTGDVLVTTAGDDISAAGGERLVIRRRSGVIDEACNGGCDDLRLDNQLRGNAVREVRVLDAAGRCVVCRTGGRLVFGGTREVWRIAGRGPLSASRQLERATP